MKLRKVHIRDFQSVRDSIEFEVGDITCLVGKNEAGKTALLDALKRLNPLISKEGTYGVTDDYPRWDVEDYRIAVESGKRPHAIVCRAVFELDNEDAAAVADVFGAKILGGLDLVLSKGYENKLSCEIQVNTRAAIQHLAGHGNFATDLKAELETCASLESMTEVLGKAEVTDSVKNLKALLQAVQEQTGLSTYIYRTILLPRVPKFLYFDEYYEMEGRANIEELKKRRQEESLKPSDHPLLGLINLARLELDQLINPPRTRELKNRLEGAGNHLTQRIVKYWSQNRHLQLQFDVRPARPEDPDGMRTGTNIWGDVYDTVHMATTELGTRSRGFVWFFSFLAWYSDVKRQEQRVILLLDEPGLSLHAKAQEDLLRYFDAEVRGHHQLIYTTHSPFMVDPTPLQV